ncbi:MAG: rod shape-determining protein MreC [Eubacteriales bacterium]|nr:rod shape-determining protein MreC [Eubacteriales bacterium]
MSQGRKSRVLILIIVSLGLVALILFSSLPERPLSMLNSPLSAVLTPLRKAGRSVKLKLGDYFSSSREQAALRASNEALLAENLQLRLEIRANEKAAEEFHKIRDAFKLKEAFPQQSFQAAHILATPGGKELDLINVDVGTNDGLLLSGTSTHAVLSASAAVYGRVYSADYRSAKILPAWHEGFSISARSEADTAHSFRVRGDFRLKDERLLLADQIPVAAAVRKGDLIVSSGSGGIFPPGLAIGYIEELYDAAEEGFREAVVRPLVDFSDCPIVFVLLSTDAEEELK